MTTFPPRVLGVGPAKDKPWHNKETKPTQPADVVPASPVEVPAASVIETPSAHTNGASPDYSATIEFLEHLRPGGPWVLTAIIPDGKTKTETAKDHDAVCKFCQTHDGERNLYFSVNPTRTALTNKAAKIDISQIEYLLADLDPRGDEKPEDAKARYQTALEKCKPPTILIDSGNGVQGLWKLVEPIVLGELADGVDEDGKPCKVLNTIDKITVADVEGRSAALMEHLGGDAGTQNIDRILRLPGTINLPNAKKIKEGRTPCPTKLLPSNGATYQLDDFPSPQSQSTNSSDTPPAAQSIPELFNSLPAGLKKQIAAEPYKDEDTSRTAASVIEQLQTSSWSDVDIAGLFRAYPIGRRYVEGNKDLDAEIKRLRRKWQDTEQPIILRSYYAEELEQQPVEQVDWNVKDFIPSRAVTGLFGDGGTGKDLLLLMLSTAATCNRLWLGKEVKQGRVMYFPVEDDDKELRRRQADISEHYGLRYADFPRSLKITPLAGKDTVLAVFDQKSGIVKPTPMYFEIKRMVADFKPTLVIVGNRVNIFSVNQNDDSQARQCLQLLSAIALEYDAGVIMPGHVSVAGMSNNTGTSGTVQWSNGCRSRLFLSRLIDKDGEPDTDARLLEVRKANWGPTNQKISIRWTQGVFVQDTGAVAASWAPAELHAAVAAEKEFLRMLDLTIEKVSLKLTANNYAPKVFSQDLRCKLKSREVKKQLAAAMERLHAKGLIVTAGYGPPSNRREHLIRAPEIVQEEPK